MARGETGGCYAIGLVVHDRKGNKSNVQCPKSNVKNQESNIEGRKSKVEQRDEKRTLDIGRSTLDKELRLGCVCEGPERAIRQSDYA